MFADSLWFNGVAFVLGQIAAWGYLRTGRVARGAALMVGGWVLADVALLARFAYDHQGGVYLCALLGMQVYSLVEFTLFVVRRWLRRRPAARDRRASLYRQAVTHYVRNELDQAEQLQRQLMRADPWDVDVAVALGCLLVRRGEPRRARRTLRAASALDRDARYVDVIREELARV